MPAPVAVIDCGTNTFHLLIKEVENDIVLHREKRPVRIGEGGISDNRITNKALSRGIEALKSFRDTLQTLGVVEYKAIGTSAFRSASNIEQVKSRIKEETSIDINVIDGELEAQLIYEGVRSAVFMKSDETYLIMDIGGGSVEFILASGERILWKRSFEIGGRRLLDLFHKSDPISKDEICKLEVYIDAALDDLWNACKEHQPSILIGASGSFDSLVEIYHRKNNMLFILEDHPEYKLPTVEFNRIHSSLVNLNYDERLKFDGLIPMRAEMIVVASSLIDYTLKKLGIEEIRTSTFALKEGVIERIKNKEFIS